jgi:DNA-binding XRE family transcriptional regulator
MVWSSGLTTPSSATAEGGAAPAWWVERRRRKQVPCALLDICSRTIVAHFPAISVYRRMLQGAPKNPQTLGEHLRLARIDRGLKQTELAQLLGVVYQTVEKWEHNLVPVSPKSRARVVVFLGYDPALPHANPTRGCFGD